MKKIIPLMFFLNFAVCIDAIDEENKEANKIYNSLTSINSGAFPSTSNLVLFRKEAGGLGAAQYPIESWNGAVSAAGAYVDKNASELKKYFTELSAINDLFVNTRKVIFNAYIAPALKGKNAEELKALKINGLSRIDPAHLDFNKVYANMALIRTEARPVINKLERVIAIDKELKSTLKKYRESRTTRKIKGDACELLIPIADTLEVVIAKYRDDLDKLNKAVSAAKAAPAGASH